jgi:bifunctional non-homologous end joining protein LigD
VQAIIESVVAQVQVIRFSRHIKGKGKAAFRDARRYRHEGIMAKGARGLYSSGKHSREWLKIKTLLRQEVVIVGYTRPRRLRQFFGALVFAVRKGNKWNSFTPSLCR